MSSSPTPEPSHRSTHRVARRSLVRTGVTAAWAVPAVTVVAAAPAFAACSGQANLGTSTHLSPLRVGKLVTVTVVLRNSGATTSGLALSVTNSGHTLDSLSAAGWSTATASGGGSATLTSVAAAQQACSAIGTVSTFLVTLHSGDPSQSLTFTFTTTGGAGYSFSVAV